MQRANSLVPNLSFFVLVLDIYIFRMDRTSHAMGLRDRIRGYGTHVRVHTGFTSYMLHYAAAKLSDTGQCVEQPLLGSM